MPPKLRRVSLLLLAAPATLLGWGYWHARTHATLNLSLYDVSLKNDRQAYGRVEKADIGFVNAEGKVLAQGSIREPYGVLALYHPEIGDCSRYERQASSDSQAREDWQRCFKAQSRWLTTWVHDVRYVTVEMNQCRVERLPVLLRKYTESWWLWWVPLPHIGGKPYTHVELTGKLDSVACRASEL